MTSIREEINRMTSFASKLTRVEKTLEQMMHHHASQANGAPLVSRDYHAQIARDCAELLDMKPPKMDTGSKR